jgi:hypothetical protein
VTNYHGAGFGWHWFMSYYNTLAHFLHESCLARCYAAPMPQKKFIFTLKLYGTIMSTTRKTETFVC